VKRVASRSGTGPADQKEGRDLGAQLDAALRRVRKEPDTLLISSIPIGVDVCLDKKPGRVAGLPFIPKAPKEPASADSRYVGRTPLVVPIPKAEVVIYLSYAGQCDESKMVGFDTRVRQGRMEGNKFIVDEGKPVVGVVEYNPSRKVHRGARIGRLRSVIVLFAPDEPGAKGAKRPGYLWPGRPHFTDWIRALSGPEKAIRAAGLSEAQAQAAVQRLASSGVALVETPKGPVKLLLVLGEGGVVTLAVSTPK